MDAPALAATLAQHDAVTAVLGPPIRGVLRPARSCALGAPRPDPIARAAAVLEADPALHIADLAARVGLSERHLRRRFEDELGLARSGSLASSGPPPNIFALTNNRPALGSPR